jgi:hypothetical protein
MGQHIAQEMSFASLPGNAGKTFPNGGDLSPMSVRDDQRRATAGTLFQLVKELGVRFTGFFQHRLGGQHFSPAGFINAADEQNGHTNHSTVVTDFFIQRASIHSTG